MSGIDRLESHHGDTENSQRFTEKTILCGPLRGLCCSAAIHPALMRIAGAIAAIVALACLLVSAPPPAVEKLRNDRIVATEFTLKPGETISVEGRHPAVTVYFDSGSLEFKPPGGRANNAGVKRGEVAFNGAQAGQLRNTGSSELKFVRTELLTEGRRETWGAAGLAPDYKLLIENPYTRVYDIRIPAGGREPQHTHKARVVVCLSGATLKHLMPDGREEPSTLKTGEVAWRPGATHIGVNLGTTDLWVVAIEPK